MKRELLSSLESTVLPEIAVVIFFSVFVLSVVWILRPGARDFYARRAQLPLEDEPLPAGSADGAQGVGG